MIPRIRKNLRYWHPQAISIRDPGAMFAASFRMFSPIYWHPGLEDDSPTPTYDQGLVCQDGHS